MGRRKSRKGFLKNLNSQFYRSACPEGRNCVGEKAKVVINYDSNSLGYRGEELNPSAKLHIYVAGDSHAGGSGIENWKDTSSHIFKEIYAEDKKIPLEDINLLNFSIGGCSNDYLVRTLIGNCLFKKPDILICHFAHKKNREILGDEIKKFCASWHFLDKALLEHPVMGESNLFADLLKNILLLQYFCKKNEIKYVFSWSNWWYMDEFKKNFSDTHRYLLEEIDFSFFLEKHIVDVRVDYALDYDPNTNKGHCGPNTHKIYAKLIYDKYKEKYG